MAFRRRRSAFRGGTGSIGWIRWNRSGKDGTLGLSGCLRPLRGFNILGRAALETLPDSLVEKHVPSRAVRAATSDGNRNDKGSRPLFTRRRRCGCSAVLARHKRFENLTARISPKNADVVTGAKCRLSGQMALGSTVDFRPKHDSKLGSARNAHCDLAPVKIE